MDIFLDTEFIEVGPHEPIDLISIGLVAEDGREYYAISSEYDDSRASQWVKENVISKLEPAETVLRKSRDTIRREILEFVGSEPPRFIASFADYDWVVFCQLFGTMINLPTGWPMWCYDLKQLSYDKDVSKLPRQVSGEHNALADARWNQRVYEFLRDYSPSDQQRYSEDVGAQV